MKIEQIERFFYDYVARGVPYGPDDGTIAPWAAVTSLPFAPEVVLPTIRHFNELHLQDPNPYGYKATINQTFPDKSKSKYGWVSEYHYGINQGPIILMIENYQSQCIWQLMRECSYIRDGLRRAGFGGAGCLIAAPAAALAGTYRTRWVAPVGIATTVLAFSATL